MAIDVGCNHRWFVICQPIVVQAHLLPANAHRLQPRQY